MNPANQFVRWTRSVLGTREGSGRQSRWAAAAGISPSTAWCAAFVAYGLRKLGIQPPSDPAYSGSWLTWSGGERVEGGIAHARPGDLLVFDWGDGGRTDHIAVYTGQGRMTSGNDSNNSVGSSSVPTGNIVGIVRPKGFGAGGTDYGGGPIGFAKEFVFGDPLEALNIGSGDALKNDVTGLLGGAASSVGGEVVSFLGQLLGEKAATILLNIGLVGGGAFLFYF